MAIGRKIQQQLLSTKTRVRIRIWHPNATKCKGGEQIENWVQILICVDKQQSEQVFFHQMQIQPIQNGIEGDLADFGNSDEFADSCK